MASTDDSSVEPRNQKARRLWLDGDDLGKVEELYRAVWNDEQLSSPASEEMPQHVRTAGTRLALLLLQSDRVLEADKILEKLGFQCRLSHAILSSNPSPLADDRGAALNIVGKPPCQILANFLDKPTLHALQSIYNRPDASYWTEHNYSVEPPSPYFSFVLPLEGEEVESPTILTALIQSLHQQAIHFKPMTQQARAVELWAHNRPHASGHQLHFDTDNEGCGGIVKHPLVTCILYLDSSAGGPSMVTTQRVSSRALAETAWMCAPVTNQVMWMDGKVLHGVLPGRGNSANRGRRVTLMVAFWKDIRVRQGGVGAARPFPYEATWAQPLLLAPPTKQQTLVGDGDCQEVINPRVVDRVYECVGSGKPWTRSMGLPNYDQVWQP